MYSSGLHKDKKRLVGVHNISEDKLLANQSAAVVDMNKSGYEGHGDISFVMPSLSFKQNPDGLLLNDIKMDLIIKEILWKLPKTGNF